MQDSLDIELRTLKDQKEDSTLIIQSPSEFDERSDQVYELQCFDTDTPLLLIPEDLPPSSLSDRSTTPQFPIKRARSTSFQLRRGIQEVRNIIARKVFK